MMAQKVKPVDDGKTMPDKAIPVKVAVRIRPLNDRENKQLDCLRTAVNDQPQIIVSTAQNKEKTFTYNYVFDKGVQQWYL